MRATLPLGLAGLIAGIMACAEVPTGTPAPVIPAGSVPVLATLRGTVDLDRPPAPSPLDALRNFT